MIVRIGRDFARRVYRAIKAIYRLVTKSGIFFDKSELWMCSGNPTAIVDVMLDSLSPNSVGCGTGQTIRYLLNRGIDARGIEGSALAIETSPVRDRIMRADLRQPVRLGRVFDVVWSFEVAEHLHETHADTFLDSLCRHPERVIMSAAQPGQPGDGHFNCQPSSHWIAKMSHRGYRIDPALMARLRAAPDGLAGNMMAFVREPS